MLVIDSMHCILEGLVQYHCRKVLQFDSQELKNDIPCVPAFSYPWTKYHSDVPPEYRVKHEGEVAQISRLQDVLVLSLESGPGSLTEDELRAKLLNKNLSPLKFICYSLGLPTHVMCGQNVLVPAKTKKHFVQLLMNWVSCTEPIVSLY